MSIFMITSVPVNPPWDQGDKNLAYSLARALPHIHFHMLTARGLDPPVGENISPLAFFRDRDQGLFHKANVFRSLLSFRGEISAYHFIMRPYPLASQMFRIAPKFRKHPIIQTVPATADGKVLNKQLFFGDRIVTLSEAGRNSLESHGIKNVRVIPPGIHIDEWSHLSMLSSEFKGRLGLNGHPVVLFPGHYGKGQGADLMFKVLPRVISAVPEARIVFACRIRSAGDLEAEQSIQHQIDQLRLSHAVRFFNRVDDMKSLIGASDIVALPLQSMRDKLDFPTTLLEGMAARKAVVISDLDPLREMIHHEASDTQPAGITVPVGDVPALANTLTNLLEDKPMRDCIGGWGEILVRKRYDIRIVARLYENLYQELI